MKRPNVIQRALHRFFMLKPVTAFFAPRTHVLDGFILKISGGRRTLSELLGWTIIQVLTTGAKTGNRHTSILIGVMDGEHIVLIASNFGRQRNPGWYYNLKKTPKCEVRLGNRAKKYLAREVFGEDRERCWRLVLSVYQGYEKYKKRAAPRPIPVMILEPEK
ncbi:MAG: nitroreductase family deazaflavin-dependent oxidoreductase [Anaerolineaceae bacterium]|nr:MAG: nitroreductase family deazaflavin-dependent oxidoreductase [Anaerolineaceae bacterium]